MPVGRAGRPRSRGAAPPQPLDMRVLSAGHFVADAGTLAPNQYRITIAAGGGVQASTTFNVKLSSKG